MDKKEKEKEKEKEKGVKEKEKDELEVEFANPMVLDRLGTEEGGREIKYFVFFPFTDDAFIFSPEYGHTYSDRAGIELALPQMRARFDNIRITNQFTLGQTDERLDLLLVIIDVYAREAFASLLGVFVNIKKIGDNFQQVIMYGPKMKAGYENFIDPRLRPPFQPFMFDFARSFKDDLTTEESFRDVSTKEDSLIDEITIEKSLRDDSSKEDSLNDNSSNEKSLIDESSKEKSLNAVLTKEKSLNDDSSDDSSTRQDVIFSQVDSSGLIFNYSFFFSRYPRFLIGFEILIFYDVNFGKFSYFAIFPQIQVRMSKEFKVDFGPGLVFTPRKVIPGFASRILIETVPKEKENKTEEEEKDKEKGTKGEENKNGNENVNEKEEEDTREEANKNEKGKDKEKEESTNEKENQNQTENETEDTENENSNYGAEKDKDTVVEVEEVEKKQKIKERKKEETTSQIMEQQKKTNRQK